ncbi:MAG: prepilin-type N-terminal cleavage/methylation domain-containing protein [Planctomycetota bacterium]|nr:prepilin-type N-terminal cleavage/methylation domain-containing protein [Planctomycetota bacterium]
MKMPPQTLAVFKTDAFNTEPMALATGSPRITGFATESNFDRRTAPGASARGSGCRGFTLIEAMIAITMTLIIMLALAQGFKRLSDDISQGRARLALSDQLRSVSEVLRNDLASLTVDPDPTTPNNKLGYFMYYDGPVTDYTAATLPINTVANGTTEQRLSASKYGDFDDILMFTAKAKGDLFKGRVPLAVVKGAAAAQSGTAYTPSQSDWVNSVVLASEFAEIAYFMVPMNVDTDPTTGEAEFTIPQIDASGSLLFEDRDLAVNTGVSITLPSTRPFSATPGVGNGVPDRMILCRRVLLIIPSLNVPLPTTPIVQGLINTQSAPDPTIASLRFLVPQFGVDSMSTAFQGADLSMRRGRTGSSGGLVPVAANSLEDLANPANRFAHTMLTFSANSGITTTMPILALTPPIPIQEYALSRGTAGASRVSFNSSNRGAGTFEDYANASFPEAGFIAPTFLRHNRIQGRDPANPTGPLIAADDGLAFSESLASNCVAFDLKGFDPSARLLYHAGPDGNVGTAVPPATNGVFGTAGTDDLVLSPNDPGYDDSIGYLINPATAPSTWTPSGNPLSDMTASMGCFVDVGWGFKSTFSLNPAISSIFVTPLSGLRVGTINDPPANIVQPAIALLKSGRCLLSSYNAPFQCLIYQPCFDSFTDVFENDGYDQNQTTLNWGSIFSSTSTMYIYLNGLPSPTPLPPGADQAINGLDDNNNGQVDELEERDTSPPINFAMPAIQATIRLEDKQAGVIQQIAVTQALVNP